MTPFDKVKVIKMIEAHLNGGYKIRRNRRSKLWKLVTAFGTDAYIFSSIDSLLGLDNMPWDVSIFDLDNSRFWKNETGTDFIQKNSWLTPLAGCSSLEEIVLRLSIMGYWK